jgi:hypothetical protein
VETQNRYFVVRNCKHDRDPSFESDNTQAGTQIVPPLAAFARELEAVAIGLQARCVTQRNLAAGAFCNPIANAEKVTARLWREGDGSTVQRRALRRPLL